MIGYNNLILYKSFAYALFPSYTASEREKKYHKMCGKLHQSRLFPLSIRDTLSSTRTSLPNKGSSQDVFQDFIKEVSN